VTLYTVNWLPPSPHLLEQFETSGFAETTQLTGCGDGEGDAVAGEGDAVAGEGDAVAGAGEVVGATGQRSPTVTDSCAAWTHSGLMELR
jgi:hypothetical protein